jgi:hypothetical protein
MYALANRHVFFRDVWNSNKYGVIFKEVINN